MLKGCPLHPRTSFASRGSSAAMMFLAVAWASEVGFLFCGFVPMGGAGHPFDIRTDIDFHYSSPVIGFILCSVTKMSIPGMRLNA
jgi:hypothetical protein